MADQMMQDQQDGQDAPAKKRVSRGQRIPQATITEVLPLMEALASFNGPALKKMVAGAMGISATGGRFRAKWSTAGYYGFRDDVAGDRSVLSERGRALVSDDPAAVLEAKQHAVVSTGFRVILDRFSTSPVNPAAIEAVLEEDLEVPSDQVKKVASLVVACAEEAELVVNNRFQVAAIEPAIEAVGEITVTATPKPANNGAGKAAAPKMRAQPAAPLRQASPNPKTPARIVQKVEAEGQAGPFDVSVEIKIDAKEHTPKQIGEIVREVREAMSPAA